jgi:pimeloyl-ACP methyl ester carboxylesterase
VRPWVKGGGPAAELVLMGESMGGLLALGVAQARPDLVVRSRVQSLVFWVAWRGAGPPGPRGTPPSPVLFAVPPVFVVTPVLWWPCVCGDPCICGNPSPVFAATLPTALPTQGPTKYIPVPPASAVTPRYICTGWPYIVNRLLVVNPVGRCRLTLSNPR